MKISKSTFLLKAGLFCFAIVFLCFENLPSQETFSPCEISPEITKIVAEKKLDHEKKHLMKKEFENGIIASGDFVAFQDLNGKCVARCYKVIDQSNDNYLGYIVVSAISSLPPFLQSSDGPLPIDNLKKCEIIATEKMNSTPSAYSLLYLEGVGMNFFVKYSFPEEKNLILSLELLGIISESKARNQQLMLDNRIKKIKSKAKGEWEKYLQ